MGKHWFSLRKLSNVFSWRIKFSKRDFHVIIIIIRIVPNWYSGMYTIRLPRFEFGHISTEMIRKTQGVKSPRRGLRSQNTIYGHEK